MRAFSHRRAPDDIPHPERIRSLLKDLREVRQGKAREGIQHLNPVELNVIHQDLPFIFSLSNSKLILTESTGHRFLTNGIERNPTFLQLSL